MTDPLRSFQLLLLLLSFLVPLAFASYLTSSLLVPSPNSLWLKLRPSVSLLDDAARSNSSILGLKNAGQFTYLVTINIGNQNFQVTLDTGSTDLWIVTSDCNAEDCHGISRYGKSDTQKLTNSSFTLNYLHGTATGVVGYDVVRLGSYQISSQVMAFVNDADGFSLSSNGNSGILGLSFALPQSLSPARGPTLIENLYSSLPDPQKFFAFHLGRNSSDSSFSVGALDPNYLQSTDELRMFNVYVQDGGQYDYWKVLLQSISVNGTKNTFKLSPSKVQGSNSPVVVFDTGTTLILGPSADVRIFWNTIGSSRKTSEGVWQVRCERAFVVSFSFGGCTNCNGSNVEFAIDPADLSWRQGGSEDGWCTGGLQENDGVISGDWLLGATFLRNVYASHHEASSSTPPSVGLKSTLDIASALSSFRSDRGPDTAAPVSLKPLQALVMDGLLRDVLAALVAGVGGFVIGALGMILCARRRSTQARKERWVRQLKTGSW